MSFTKLSATASIAIVSPISPPPTGVTMASVLNAVSSSSHDLTNLKLPVVPGALSGGSNKLCMVEAPAPDVMLIKNGLKRAFKEEPPEVKWIAPPVKL